MLSKNHGRSNDRACKRLLPRLHPLRQRQSLCARVAVLFLDTAPYAAAPVTPLRKSILVAREADALTNN